MLLCNTKVLCLLRAIRLVEKCYRRIYNIIERRVRRYQRGNQNSKIEEEQTIQLPKEKAQKDKQRSTKHTHKTKDRVTRTSLKLGVNSGARKGRQFQLQ